MKSFNKLLVATCTLVFAMGTGLAYGYSSPNHDTTSFQIAAGGNVANGKKTYNMYCTSCHGAGGKGDGPAGKALNPKPADFSKGKFKYSPNDAAMMAFIKKGKGAMPAWGAVLKDPQINDVVAFIRSLKH